MKQLPPIFKVSNNIRDTNQKYFYEKATNKIKPPSLTVLI